MRVLIDLIVLVIEIIVLIGGVATLIHSLHTQREISNEEAAASQQSDREAAQRKLLNVMENHHKQPQLWWGDECVTISEDGKKVVHIQKPQPKPAKLWHFNSETAEWEYAETLFMMRNLIVANLVSDNATSGFSCGGAESSSCVGTGGSGHGGSRGSGCGSIKLVPASELKSWGTVETN